MTLPPFPSQDLAKLVLGYLAEEQLMTAYDEFLQASPYLDALRNEYDRIFMTSLKSILAEYRAVKIYVEKCKPYTLRKKIFQCTNLLDIVKFLVTNVDINKILLQEPTDKASVEKQNITIVQKPYSCEVCQSLKLASCACKMKQTDHKELEDVSASRMGSNSNANSVETTPLADLPGSHVTTRKKKDVKLLEKDSSDLSFIVSSIHDSDSGGIQSYSNNNSSEDNSSKCSTSSLLNNTENSNVTVKAVDSSKQNQNIDEFNDVLKSVVNRNKTVSGSECTPNQRISNASTFQDFASGVSSGENQTATYSVPDSSTSENLNVKTPLTKDLCNDNTKCQLLLQVSQVNDNIEIQTCRGEITKPLKPAKLPTIQPKPKEKKIKIISDIKVGNKYNDKKKECKSSLKTSTPLMQMQTIVINGTPAYKHTPKTHAYTEDEIMAMPTLIVVPASGPSQISTSVHCQPIMSQSCNAGSTINSSPKILGPLVIDVPSNARTADRSIITALPTLNEQKSLEPGLVKTVDFKNSSVPKDNVISLETKTPQVMPPTRKSSSTPRRTSHVRVLEFTTPRRILHETITEQATSESSDPPIEVVVSGNTDIITTKTTPENVTSKNECLSIVNSMEGNNNDNGSAKENEGANIVKPPKKKDWDADLRALIGANEINNSSTKSRRTRTSRHKKSIDKLNNEDKDDSQSKSRSKKSSRTRKTKSKQKLEEEIDVPSTDLEHKKDVPIKPTINIICGNNRAKADLQEKKNVVVTTQNISNEEVGDCLNTPETERLSLQNVIGAKLDICDLLETPYKQALYDIQMDTPRFIGPDLPGEPLSDIKIMNIPTPRFLDTPKHIQDTPYTSRPTDYSSGGSYYKPDDQDYNIHIPEIMVCPVTSSKDDSAEKTLPMESDERKSRPVRQCTKNVSYYKNCSLTNKLKDSEYIDGNSSCSETKSLNSSLELKPKKEVTIKTPKDKPQQSRSRTDPKRSNSTYRKGTSPRHTAKDKTKSFMKIKPRYTPKKDPAGRIKKRPLESPYSKGSSNLHRKSTSSNDKTVKPTPPLTAMPTKSRRKSSTPRKLHCTKTFNSESSGHDSPETVANSKLRVDCDNTNTNNFQDSDTEQIALHWSDDGSQDGKTKDTPTNVNDVEDIKKIQDFIHLSDKTIHPTICEESLKEKSINKQVPIEGDGALQRDLMKRGFDLETAKIIERDLLDDTPIRTEITSSRSLPISVEPVAKKSEYCLEKTIETDSSNTAELQIVQDEADDDEVELSVHECNEESSNYIVFEHDNTKEISPGPPIKLKDKFTMEVCIDDDLTVRLKATAFSMMLDQDPLTVDEIDYCYKETERAVNSISNIERLYTPLKESIKAQCYEIFDSTLTSLDTPLKANSPLRACDTSVTGLVLDKELTGAKDVTEIKKRKRLQSGLDESASDCKRAKQDADILFQTANIQNIDIESVLTKLHGP